MTDETLRRAERAGDDEMSARVLVERLRRGLVDEARLRVAARLGHAPARLALELEQELDAEPLTSLLRAFELHLGDRAAVAAGLALGRLLAPFSEPSSVLAAAAAAWRQPGGERAERAQLESEAAEAAEGVRPEPVWSDARGALARTARRAAAWCAWAASTRKPEAGPSYVSGLASRVDIPAEVDEATRTHLAAALLPWATGASQDLAEVDGEALRARILAAVEAEITSGARDPVLQHARREHDRLAARDVRLRRVVDAAPGSGTWRATFSCDSHLFGVGVDEGSRVVVAALIEEATDALIDMLTPEMEDPTPMPTSRWRCEAPLDGTRVAALREELAGCAIVAQQDVAQWRCGGSGSLITVIGDPGPIGPRFEITSPWALVETAANARFADLLLDAAAAAFSQEPRVLERIAALARHRQVEPSPLEDD